MTTTKTNKGLLVDIFRSNYHSELNVFNGKQSAIFIDASGPFQESESSPAVKLVKRALFGSEYIHAEPVKPGSYAFGGSFIYSSDSRFSEVSKYPIPLHDRDMSLERGTFD